MIIIITLNIKGLICQLKDRDCWTTWKSKTQIDTVYQTHTGWKQMDEKDILSNSEL